MMKLILVLIAINIFTGITYASPVTAPSEKAPGCIDMRNHDDFFRLSQTFEAEGRYEEAIVAYLNAVRLQPGMLQARLRLAELRQLLGNDKGALEEYAKYLEAQPESPDVQIKMARILARKGETSLAISQYVSILRHAPADIAANREIAYLYKSRGDLERATVHFRKVIELDRKERHSRDGLMSIYLYKKNYNHLLELLLDSAEQFPGEYIHHFRLGVMHDQMNSYKAAIASLERALDLKPDHLKTMSVLRRVYSKTGEFEKAKRMQQTIKELDKDQLLPLESLGSNHDFFDPEPRKLTDIKQKKPKAKKNTGKKSPKPGKSGGKKVKNRGAE